MSTRGMGSGIKFDLVFHSSVPVTHYNIHYQVSYSNIEHSWTENGLKKQEHVSKPWTFEYNYQAEKQEVSKISFYNLSRYTSLSVLPRLKATMRLSILTDSRLRLCPRAMIFWRRQDVRMRRGLRSLQP